jgi:hypothetical protein
MARKPERSPKKGDSSPISARQKSLAEEDTRIKAEEERIKKMLQNAPKKREELVRKQRDEFIKRKTKVVHIDRPIDKRFDAITDVRPARPRKMRKDRSFSQLLSILLFLALCIALYYAFRVIGH